MSLPKSLAAERKERKEELLAIIAEELDRVCARSKIVHLPGVAVGVTDYPETGPTLLYEITVRAIR